MSGHVVENIRVQAGARLFLDLEQANKDEAVFSSPDEHRIGRPKEKHLFGEGSITYAKVFVWSKGLLTSLTGFLGRTWCTRYMQPG